MIAAFLMALAAQPTIQVAPNPGAPAVPGVAFVCYLSIDGTSTIFKGVTPDFPPEHPAGIRLPMEWKVDAGPSKFAGKRWVALPTDFQPVAGGQGRTVQQASAHHRQYSVAFRLDGEPEYNFTLLLVDGYNGLGVLSQRNTKMPFWPGKTISQASCTSDFSASDAKGTVK